MSTDENFRRRPQQRPRWWWWWWWSSPSYLLASFRSGPAPSPPLSGRLAKISTQQPCCDVAPDRCCCCCSFKTLPCNNNCTRLSLISIDEPPPPSPLPIPGYLSMPARKIDQFLAFCQYIGYHRDCLVYSPRILLLLLWDPIFINVAPPRRW